jgi:hypothetical protein
MKHKVLTALALVTMVIAVTTARAQTVANGPYYAPPAWDQTLPVVTRFIVLSNFGGAAVLDRETGLVWERSPSESFVIWSSAQKGCNRKSVGNRLGWRLPTLQELASLLDGDPANTSGRLPPAHPFTVRLTALWSATTFANDTNLAWFVDFRVDGAISELTKAAALAVWCVRGGQGVDPQ